MCESYFDPIIRVSGFISCPDKLLVHYGPDDGRQQDYLKITLRSCVEFMGFNAGASSDRDLGHQYLSKSFLFNFVFERRRFSMAQVHFENKDVALRDRPTAPSTIFAQMAHHLSVGGLWLAYTTFPAVFDRCATSTTTGNGGLLITKKSSTSSSHDSSLQPSLTLKLNFCIRKHTEPRNSRRARFFPTQLAAPIENGMNAPGTWTKSFVSWEGRFCRSPSGSQRSGQKESGSGEK